MIQTWTGPQAESDSRSIGSFTVSYSVPWRAPRFWAEGTLSSALTWPSFSATNMRVVLGCDDIEKGANLSDANLYSPKDWLSCRNRRGRMPLFMDTHKKGHGLTAEEVVKAHQRDLEVQAKYGVRYV